MDSLTGIGRTVFFGRGDPEPEPMPPAAPVEEALPSKEIGFGFDDNDSENDNELENGIDNDDAPVQNTVVSLADIEGPNDDDDDIPAGAPVAPMDIVEAPATATKKRGRPSLSASASRTGTPAAKARTPGRATETPATNGVKRKAAATPADSAAPSAKRGRPSSAPVSARKAAKAAAVKPGRKAANGPKTPKAAGKRGRKPGKQISDEEEGDAYEVEKIVDDGIDADTMEHMFFVKWEGYSDSENTWEPRKNLHCEELISAYEKAKKKAEAANKPARTPRGTKAPKNPKAPKSPKAPKAAKIVKKAKGTGRRGRPARKAKA